MADSLPSLLRTLRVRAGNPSYRAIERLIATQGRKDQIRRATIQEKISGRSPANLMQVLSIVEALADYARSIGAPLAAEEVDIRLWRERVSEAVNPEVIQLQQPPSMPTSVEFQPAWDTRHLQIAGMSDVIAVVNSSRDRPVAEWLPGVISILKKAKMSLDEFLDTASRQQVGPLIDTVAALHFGSGGANETLSAADLLSNEPAEIEILLNYAARFHAAEDAPVIAVSLRRADMEAYVTGFIRAVAQKKSPQDLLVALNALYASSLSSDASELVGFIGSFREAGDVIEVVDFFSNGSRRRDADGILEEVGGTGRFRILEVSRSIEDAREDKIDILDRIIRGMDWSRPSETAGYFEKMKEPALAALIREKLDLSDSRSGDK
ncbi:hypothetical protein ACFYYB_25590 [Streptomyces sp. NPDC002886]|uniref:hypothetical protein n=1 Tax=Streptomyces sp. NPDC002886 TaxID=3364667 RepID=UPI00368E3EA1